MWLAKFFLVIVLNIVCLGAVKISCKNEKNADIDWFYLYKLPKFHSNDLEQDQTGLRYTYVTAETFASQSWQLSRLLINNSLSFPGQTLSALFNDPEVLLIAYNDQHPDGFTDFENGHTKGLVATDGVHAIWLIHSVPKYPQISDYTYPRTGEHFGQSFLCVTLNATTQMDIVSKQLLYNEPSIYYSRIPASLAGRYADLEKVIGKKWISTAPFHSLAELKTLNGTVFKSFAKGRLFNAELYRDLISPTLNVDLLVETWRNSAGKLPSDCSKREKVFNVKMIHDGGLNFSFKSTMDHSKWAVAKEDEDNWICVGDINRAEHQYVRGGGTLCQQSLKIANTYRSLISSFEKCTV